MPYSLLRWVFTGIVLSMAGYLGYALIQHTQSHPPAPEMASPVFDAADAKIQDFVYRQTQEGRVQWEVEAQNAQVYEAEHHAVLERVQVRLLGVNGQKMVLEAEAGTLDTATSNFDLHNREKRITIELANGYTILTPHLHWTNGEQAIHTNHPVTIHGHGLTITGIGLIAELRTEQFTVLDDVRVEVVS